MGRRRIKGSERKKLRAASIRWLENFGKVDDVTKRTLSRGLDRAWASGDIYIRYAAVHFIWDTTPLVGQGVLPAVLRSRQPGLLPEALASAAHYLRKRRKLQEPLISALKHVAQNGVLHGERERAAKILARANVTVAGEVRGQRGRSGRLSDRPDDRLRMAWLGWLEERRRGKIDRKMSRTLERTLKRAWLSRDLYLQYSALYYVFETRQPSGQAVLVDALKSKHPGLVGNALSAAMMYTWKGPELQKQLVKALQHTTEHGTLASDRWFALDVLGHSGLRKLDGWFSNMVKRRPPHEHRYAAARILTRRGFADGKDLMLESLRASPRAYMVGLEVWSDRETLKLTDSEEREVRKIIRRHIRSFRTWMRKPNAPADRRRWAAGFLRDYAADGFTLTENDLREIGKVERQEARAATRKRARG